MNQAVDQSQTVPVQLPDLLDKAGRNTKPVAAIPAGQPHFPLGQSAVEKRPGKTLGLKLSAAGKLGKEAAEAAEPV